MKSNVAQYSPNSRVKEIELPSLEDRSRGEGILAGVIFNRSAEINKQLYQKNLNLIQSSQFLNTPVPEEVNSETEPILDAQENHAPSKTAKRKIVSLNTPDLAKKGTIIKFPKFFRRATPADLADKRQADKLAWQQRNPAA